MSRPPASLPLAELFVRANTRFGAGDLDGAIADYREVLAREPRASGVLNNLGLALHAAGDARAAADAFRESLSHAPRNPAAHYNLANALRALGEPRAAIDAYRGAISLEPGNAMAHNNLGAVLLDIGEPRSALDALARALALAPDSPEAHNNLGLAHLALDDLPRAEAALRRSIELAPDFADAIVNLGRVKERQGDAAEAAACYARAAGVAPGHVAALARHAALLEAGNDIDAARAIVERALALAPGDADLALVAAKIARREGRLDEAVGRLESALSGASSDDIRGALLVDLGQLHDQRGEHAPAFACFAEGNALQARVARARGIDKHDFVRRCRALIAPFLEDDGGAWIADAEAGEEQPPTFLVGFPRSGTTLLEQILDAHPAILSLDEKPTVPAIADRVLAERDRYPRALASITPRDAQALRAAYFREVDRYAERAPGTHVVDKLPLNVFRVPFIWRLFPNARFILALRHPCDVCLSCYMQSFELNSAMANFLDLEDTARLYAEAMDIWARCERVLPLSFHAVRYERVVEDAEREARAVLEFLGVEWHDAVLAFTEHAQRRGPISTPSYHQVTQPVYRRALGRWRRYEKQLAPILEVLAPYVERLGYRLD